MLVASAAVAIATFARLVKGADARSACLAGAIVCGAFALSVIYDDARRRLLDSTFFELIQERFGRQRAQLFVRAIVFDHLATTCVVTVLVAYHLRRPILAAGVAILLMLCCWRAALVPFASRDWRAATIVRTTAISGLLLMTWCGTRCLGARERTRERWLAVFPCLLGSIGWMVALRDRLRRRPVANALLIISLYALLLMALACLALAHPSLLRLTRLSLHVAIVILGLLIVFYDFAPRSRFRADFVSGLMRVSKHHASGADTTCTGISGGRRFSSLR
jgi:hypothetical protein